MSARAFELLQRESGLWVILHRTGRTANVVETGHLDRAIAALDLDSYRTSRTLSPTGQGWRKVADRLYRQASSSRHKRRLRGVAPTTDVLSRLDILRLLQAQDYKCEVSGSYFTPDAFDGEDISPFQPSIDRRNSSRGYERDNVRIVCLLVNVAMSDWGEGPLRKIAPRLLAPALRPDEAVGQDVARRRLKLIPCPETEKSPAES